MVDDGSKTDEQQGIHHNNNNNNNSNTTNTKKLVPFRSLFAFADGYDYFLMSVGALGAFVHGLSFPVFFFFFGRLVHDFGTFSNKFKDKMYHDVSKVAIYFLYLGIFVLVSSWTEVSCWIHTGERQSMKLRIRYLEAVLRHEIGYFDVDAKTGELINSVTSNSLLIQQAISEKMGNLIHYFSTFCAGITLGFVTVWQLGLVTLATVPIVILTGGFYAHVITTFASKSQKAYNSAGHIVEEAISQVRTIYSFVGEERTINSYSASLASMLPLGYRASLVKGIGMGALYAIPLCSWSLLLWYGGVLVRNGTTSGGKVLSTIFCVLSGAFALGQSAPGLSALAKARAAAFEIMKMIQEEPDANDTTGECLDRVCGDIELKSVFFSYPSRPHAPVLQDFSLRICSGQSIALVGSSGSGKSTVISLLERFYEPTSGEITLDGHNIKSLQLRWLRAQIGLVSQEPALFATSILQNLLYGKEDATMEEIETAARAANVHDFIDQLPGGYETQVGARGVQLSGGQKQRVAIARALLRNPAVVLLDEATSALDVESEKVVQEALNRIMVGRTTVVVAHRLSTIQTADRIAVLQDGKLVETGTHRQLMAEGGVYFGLVQLQEHRPLTRQEEVTVTPPARTSSASGSFRLSRLGIPSFTSREDVEESVKLQAKEAKSLLVKLVKINLPELPFLLLGLTGAVCAGLPNPIYSFIISKVVRVYYLEDLEEMKRRIQRYVIILVMVAVGSLASYVGQHYFFGVAGENLTKRVREMMLRGILRNEVSWFDEDDHGLSTHLASRLASDSIYIKAATADVMSNLTQNISVVLTAFGIAFAVEWRLATVVAATFPLIVGSIFGQKLLLRGVAGDIEASHARASTLAGEAIGNIRTVVAFNAQDKTVKLFVSELHAPARYSMLRGNVIGLAYGLSTFCLFGSYGLGLWYGASLVKHGVAKFGDVVLSFLVIILAAFPIADSIAMLPDVSKAGHAVKSVFEVLDRQTMINPDDQNAHKVKMLRGDLELRDVEFSYPSRPEVTIFRGLKLHVTAGRCMALVGSSGSGKSSVLALVQRFYDPQRGAVLVDGRDVRKLNLRTYRLHVGLVQQEPALFAMSIRDNILYGRPDASEAEVIAAAKTANAHGFISSLPSGYETSVGERGVQLSGGQKQRVAVARAVLKDPSILLLDEATSALDAESERMVQEALERLMKGRTTLVVAHRLSSVVNADEIAVLHEGCVVEKGSHGELVGKNGAYARLLNLQQLTY